MVPDILVLGKGLGGGVFPLAAIVARSDLDVAPHTSLGHYTHEKNPVACAAGLATLTVIEEQGLVDRAARLGDWVRERLEALSAAHRLAGAVRGRGLLWGLEIVDDPVTLAPAQAAAEALMYACLARGLSFKVSQGRSLTLTGPHREPAGTGGGRGHPGRVAHAGGIRRTGQGERGLAPWTRTCCPPTLTCSSPQAP